MEKRPKLSHDEKARLVREKRRQIDAFQAEQQRDAGSLSIDERVAAVESWIKAEQIRRDSYRPPSPNDVRTALQFAAALQDEHDEGKLTDAERSAVVLAGALQQIVRLWETYRSDDPDWLEKFTGAIERVKR